MKSKDFGQVAPEFVAAIELAVQADDVPRAAVCAADIALPASHPPMLASLVGRGWEAWRKGS